MAYKVCFLANRAINFAYEGHNIASIRIIKSALSSGIEAKVVSLENKNVSAKMNYIPIKTYSISKRRTSVFPSFGEIVSSVSALTNCKKINYDIIHLLNVTKEIYLLLRKVMDIKEPIVSHLFHSDHPFYYWSLNFQFRLYLLKMGFFDYVFCSNTSLMKYLIQNTNLGSERVFYIPFSVDVERFKPRNKEELREKYGLPKDAPVILYIGQIDPQRGFFYVLKSFKKLLRKNLNAILYVCHPNLKNEELNYGPFFKSLYTIFKSNIKISGPNELIEEVYSLADVILLPFQKPYWITAPPLVVLEAMSSGTPVVTTPLDVIKEIGENERNLYFVKPKSIDSISNKIESLLNNIEHANKIGVNGREYINKHHSISAVGDVLNNSYKKIIK